MASEKVKLSKDGSSIDFVQSDSMPTSVKKLRQSPEIEGFYRFIFENDLQREAYEILERIVAERKAKRTAEKAALKAEKQAAAKAESARAKAEAQKAKTMAPKATAPLPQKADKAIKGAVPPKAHSLKPAAKSPVKAIPTVKGAPKKAVPVKPAAKAKPAPVKKVAAPAKSSKPAKSAAKPVAKGKKK